MSIKQVVMSHAWRERLDPFLKPLERWRPLPPSRVPRRAPSKRSGFISTAVDTAIRIELGRRRPDAREWPWVAEDALACAAPTLWTFEGVRPFAPVVRERFFAALGAIRRYRALEAPTVQDRRRLAWASLELATLDVVGRLGMVPGDAMAVIQPEIGKGEVDEVVACLELCPWDLFDAQGVLLLGPDFGDYAWKLRGADADVIAGGRLIEIKCVDTASVGIDYLRQLFGYFLLSELIADDHWPRARVEELCLYFARHARTYRIEAARLRAMSGFEDLKRWVRQQACRGDAPQCDDSKHATARDYTSRSLIVRQRAEAFWGSAREPEGARDEDFGRQADAIGRMEALIQRKLGRSRRTAVPPCDFGLFLRWFDDGLIEVFRIQSREAVQEAASTPLRRVRGLPVEWLGDWLCCRGAGLGVGALWSRRRYKSFECAWVLPDDKCHDTVWRLIQRAA